jgi:RNA polymerase sigma factor (sigma-70 family)
MTDVTDMDLARQYAAGNSEPAFAELVRRHLNLVYSVALRHVGNPQDAQDVAQAVFVILAQKATGLGERTILTGWFYETTRFTALRFLRTKTRRQFREQEAFMQSTLDQSDSTDSVWQQLGPLLEDAMARLNEKDRTLLALRFFENKTAAETAAVLGLQEWAARKRVERALEKLRKFFGRRGAVFSSSAIAGAISANSVHAAPIGLAQTISATAVTQGAAVSTSTLTLAKGALKLMAWSKIKTGMIAGVVIFLAAATTTAMVQYERHQPPKLPPPVPVTPGQTEFPKSTWHFAGFGDPESAFQSTMWAVGRGDVKAMMETVAPALRQQFAGKTDFQIITAKDRVDFARMTGYRILDKQIVSDNEVMFEMYAEGLDQTRKFWVQRTGDEWKFARQR